MQVDSIRYTDGKAKGFCVEKGEGKLITKWNLIASKLECSFDFNIHVRGCFFKNF